MALSDELTKLAVRAKEAETRTAAARDEAGADLEKEVESARAAAQGQAEKLRQGAEGGKAEVSGWWTDVQKSWNAQVSRVREDVESKKEKQDVHMAEARADDAEGYAFFAIDLAYSAVVEAEYASLDALLARKEADQRAAEAGATA
jgi:predicted RNase H-like nuclease (RuvC/YqgF family)